MVMHERQEPGLDTPTALPSDQPAAPPRPRRRWLRRLLAVCIVLAVLLATGLTSLWWWSGRDQSLPQTLALAQRWLPPGYALEVQEARGSLRFGGEIGHLRLSSERFQLQIQELNLAWNLNRLLHRQLQVDKLHLAAVHYRANPDTPPDDSPAEPLHSLSLPLRIELPLAIDLLTWGDTPEAELRDLNATYAYDGQQHRLQLLGLNYGPQQAQLQAQAQWQGAAPMQLNASVQATLAPALELAHPLPVQATARLTGTLSGPTARLQLTADARTDSTTATAPLANPLAAHIEATLAPWQPQPLPQAEVDLQHFNLAFFAPDLPPTDLSGQLRIDTNAQGVWNVQAGFDNPLAGAWDKAALPLQRLTAQASLDGTIWTLGQLQWHLPGENGKHSGGQLQAQGRFDTQTQALDAQVQLDALDPARALSSLPRQALGGTFTAQAMADQTIDFTLDIADTAAKGKAPSSAAGLERAQAQGRWQAPQLDVRDVAIQAWGAQLHSPALAWDNAARQLTSAKSTRLTLPGASAELTGTLGQHDGQGQLHATLADAASLMAWLGRLPGLADAALPLQGQAQAQLDWQGGWGSLLPPAPATGQEEEKSVAATALKIKLSATIPQIIHAPSAQAATEIKNLTLQLDGPLDKLQASLTAQARQGEQQAQIDTRLQAGWAPQSPQSWHARLEALTLRARPMADSGDWLLALAQPVTVQQQGERIQASAGQLRLTPPAASANAAAPAASPASADIQWEPLTLGAATLGLRSQGRFSGIPLAWADLFTPQDPVLARAGVSGDLVLQGQWNIDTGARKPQLHVMLERESGDIRIAAADEDAAPVTVVRSSGTADTRETRRQPNRGQRVRLQHFQAQLGLEEGNQLRAQVLWASERAGTIHADVRSPLRRNAQGWRWAEDAPLSGSVQLLLPNIGVWASFAPPGWRVAGSFGGDVILGGTRSDPTWKGTLQAEELSIASLLDGVDLKNGQLQARFAGNRVDIERLYLEGGGHGQARILGQSGNRLPPPQAGGRLRGSGFIVYAPPAGDGANATGLHMDIQAQLDDLQVLSRADRQMGLSGTLRAQMQDAQLRLRGALTVNRAALLLADESAPGLDDDVHVTSAAQRQQDAERQAREAREAARQPAPEGSVRAALKPDIHLTLDLGPDFALQGYGLTTRLNGQLTVRGGPRVTGEIHTDRGRYRAWGQALDIEQGTIRFNGPYDNPSLDIIALRPNIAVRAGVKVAGSANAPRVQLYSDPVMPDAEKLSWVAMGRDPASGGAETALLQQAALALLSGGGSGGDLAGNIGLDELGFKGPGNGAEGAALTLGKRISQDLYLSYEQSLNGAMGTLFIFYDLTKRLTLRGQTGEQTAMDLIYTRRKD